MTPGFMLGEIVRELNYLQRESLYSEDRRTTIIKIFKEDDAISVNINFSAVSLERKATYKHVIANSIKNAVGKALKQVRSWYLIAHKNLFNI